MRSKSIEIIHAPAQSHPSVRKVETVNRVIQQTLKKTLSDPGNWDSETASTLRNVNTRTVQWLRFSPFEILHRCNVHLGVPPHYQAESVANVLSSVKAKGYEPPKCPALAEAVVRHIARLEET